MKHHRKTAVVLLSGGMDSAVSLFWALRAGYRCVALSFDYGQRHKRELTCAKSVARMAGVPHHTVQFRLPWGGSSLTDAKAHIPHHALSRVGQGGIPSTYVPARNTIFLSFALSWADHIHAQAIVIGANAVDYSGYPDCRPHYLKAVNRVARLGTRLGAEQKKSIKILAPLISMSKADIVALGETLGVPFDMTWSCYQGGKKPCGLCDACLLRAKGFEQNDRRIRL